MTKIILLSTAVSLLFIIMAVITASRSWCYELTMTVDGVNVDFGQVSPLKGDVIIPHATQIVVVSESSTWDLNVNIPDNLIDTTDVAKNIPISQLHYATHSTSPSWAAFQIGTQTLLSNQPTTSSNGKVIDYDYKLDVHWSNEVGSYHGTITYSVTAGGLDNSFASPNPFSPNADGVKDTANIYYCLDSAGTITGKIVDIADTLIKTLFTDESQSSGTHSVSWNGKNNSNEVVSNADYKYLIKKGTDVITSGIISVDCATSIGTGKIEGNVKDSANNTVLSGANITLYEASGNLIGTITSNSSGAYSFSSLAAGYYYLKSERASYYTEITENIHVADGGTTTKTIYMTHNTSLLVVKSVSGRAAQIGDILSYRVVIRNIGQGTIKNITIKDKLPYDFQYLPATARINGITCEPYGNGILIWDEKNLPEHITELSRGGTITLSYMAVVGIDVKIGLQENIVVVAGTNEMGEAVWSRPVKAGVRVREGLFANRGIILGKVYKDINGDGIQQPPEAGIPDAVIIMEDGTVVKTDKHGKYSIPGASHGTHIMMVNKGSLSFNNPLDSTLVQYIYVPEGGIVNVDFGVIQGDESVGDNNLILIALAEGEAGRFAVDGAIRSFEQGNEKFSSNIYTHAMGTLYFKGKIKGEYLLCCIANTDKGDMDEVIANIDPDGYYPVYGDESKLLVNSTSYGQLYVCIEKDKTSLMYGNYSIDYKDTVLGGYHHTFNGVKFAHDTKIYKTEIFAASNKRVSVREELQGRNICGPYYLKNTGIVADSEKIRVEVKKQGTNEVCSVSLKQKNKDYIIDYDKGIIIFDKPVPDEASGGIYYWIVVIYEYLPLNDMQYINWGIKGEINANDAIKAGIYCISEEHGFGKKTLYGINFGMKVLDILKLSGEYASTMGEIEPAVDIPDTSAYLLDALVRLKEKAHLRYFYRHLGKEFSNEINPKGINVEDERLFQYSPDYYDLTKFSPNKDAMEYGMKLDWRLMDDVTASLQQKQSHDNLSNDPKIGTAYNKITSMNMQYKKTKNSLMFFNYQHSINDSDKTYESPDSCTKGITLGMQKEKGKLNFAAKYDGKDARNYIKPEANAMNHNISFNTNIRCQPVTLSLGYDFMLGINPKSKQTITKQQTCSLGVSGEYNPLSCVSLIARSQFVYNNNHIKKESDSSLINTIALDYNPYKGFDSCIRYETKRGLCAGETLASVLGIDITKELTRDLTGYLKYNYSYSDTAVSENKQKISNSGGCLALAYRSADTNNLNILAKYDIEEKGKTLAALEAACKLTPGLKVSGKYAIRHIKAEHITSCVDMLMARTEYQLTDKINITGAHKIIHQQLTNTYKMNPLLEAGCRIKDNLRAILGYNFIEYTDGEDFFNAYSAKGWYVRIVGGIIKQK
ncbi:MAG: carboxypeptidase regulatory-like domain-containing protein [bacterium]|nr:carboxypeptidase regulatory-like domain-containing protein [bacterium]